MDGVSSMPSASILTLTADQVVSAGSASNIAIEWDTETKYLDADVDFFDAGVDPERLVIPSSLDGVSYETYIWLEDTTDSPGTEGLYLGMFAYGEPSFKSDALWGLVPRGCYYPCRGYRSGTLLGRSTPVEWISICREFDTRTITMRAARCRFGVISGEPTLLGVAAARGDVTIGGSSAAPITAAEDFDVGGVYNPATGVYTAPAGASLAVACAVGYDGDTLASNRLYYTLDVNATQIAKARFSGAGRAPGPGCFGLFPVSPGDEVRMNIDNDLGSARTVGVQTSVEFY